MRSGSMSLNLVNSHKYFQFRFFLSVTIKAVPEFSFILSYSLKSDSFTIYPMSLKDWLTIFAILHKYGVTK